MTSATRLSACAEVQPSQLARIKNAKSLKPIIRVQRSMGSVAHLSGNHDPAEVFRRSETASLSNRPAPRIVADHLSGGLRLRRCGLSIFPDLIALLRILARCHRLLLWHLLALVVVTDAIAGAACDFHALIAVGLGAEIANERADPPRLCFQRIERVDAC